MTLYTKKYGRIMSNKILKVFRGNGIFDILPFVRGFSNTTKGMLGIVTVIALIWLSYKGLF